MTSNRVMVNSSDMFLERVWISVVATFALAAITWGQTPTLPKIEPKLLQADLQIARKALEEGHSGMYRYTPKPELDRAFDSANKKLTQPMDALEFLRVLAPVVADIKCGHTSVRPPKQISEAVNQTIALFPFGVAIVDGKVYVTREYEPNEQKLAGLEIRKINGAEIDSILATMLAATPGDADSQTVRPWRVADDFNLDLYDLAGIKSPFTVEFLDSKTGKNRTLQFSGGPYPDLQKIAEKRYPQDAEPKDSVSLKFIDENMLMNGGSFSTTCEFLSNLHDRKRAIFVGEEAGGGYFGNTSGPTVRVTLPNTEVHIIIPLRTYYLAVKDGIPNRSILPDYEVKQSINDILSDNDTVMFRAIELARK